MRVLDELVGVPVAGDDDDVLAGIARPSRQGGEHVVRLVADELHDRHSERGEHLAHQSELLDEQLGGRVALGLVGLEALVAKGRLRPVERHGETGRSVVAPEVEHHRGEPVDGVGDLTARGGHVGRQGEERPIGQGVPVDQQRRQSVGLQIQPEHAHLGHALRVVALPLRGGHLLARDVGEPVALEERGRPLGDRAGEDRFQATVHGAGHQPLQQLAPCALTREPVDGVEARDLADLVVGVARRLEAPDPGDVAAVRDPGTEAAEGHPHDLGPRPRSEEALLHPSGHELLHDGEVVDGQRS